MKRWLTIIALGIVFVGVIFAAVDMAGMDRTYDGRQAAVSVYELQQNPESYDDTNVHGAADAIIQQNLATTHAVNDVTSIVFDFRGYDTMGEAFILLTCISGVTVLLRKTKAEKEEALKHGKERE